MPNYRAKVKGEFEVTQDIEAANEQEARDKLKDNLGSDVEVIATGELEVISLIETE